MSYIQVRQWYSDSTQEMRREHPSMATNKMDGQTVQSTYSGDLEVHGWEEGDTRGAVLLDWLRDIEPQGYGSRLKVITDDGEELVCDRIVGTVRNSRRKLVLRDNEGGEADERAFHDYEIERIELTE